MINEAVLRFFNGFHYDAHPMAMVTAVVGSLSAFYTTPPTSITRATARCSPTASSPRCRRIAAAAYKHSIGQPFVYPRNDLDYCSNLLNMLFSVPVRALPGGPGGGRGAGPAVHPARGPRAERQHLHGAPGRQLRHQSLCGHRRRHRHPVGPGPRRRQRGGARHARGDRQRQEHPKYLAKAKDKTSHFRLMGFGHRVYKNYDPRAKIIRATCHKVLQKLGRADDPLLELAMRLEEIALKDSTSSRRSSTRTWTSTPASSTGRSASREHVHGDVRHRPHRGLGGALAGDDRRSGA